MKYSELPGIQNYPDLPYCAVIGPILYRAARLPDPVPARVARGVARDSSTLYEDTYHPPQQALYGQCTRLCLPNGMQPSTLVRDTLNSPLQF